MADRRVARTGKDGHGDITMLCGSWGNASKMAAILDSEDKGSTYFVQQPGCGRGDIHVVNRTTGKYLRSDPDTSSDNNLDNLPDW